MTEKLRTGTIAIALLAVLAGWAAPTASAAPDRRQIIEAERFSKQRWPNQFAGVWVKDRPRRQPDTYYFAFTEGSGRKIDLIERRFPLERDRYAPETRRYSLRYLNGVKKRVMRVLVRITRGKSHIKAPAEGGWGIGVDVIANRVDVTTPKDWGGFRRWARRKYGARLVRHEIGEIVPAAEVSGIEVEPSKRPRPELGAEDGRRPSPAR